MSNKNNTYLMMITKQIILLNNPTKSNHRTKILVAWNKHLCKTWIKYLFKMSIQMKNLTKLLLDKLHLQIRVPVIRLIWGNDQGKGQVIPMEKILLMKRTQNQLQTKLINWSKKLKFSKNKLQKYKIEIGLTQNMEE